MKVAFQVDELTQDLISEYPEATVDFPENILVKKTPHTNTIAISKVSLRPTGEVEFIIDANGPLVIDIDVCDKMSQSLNQRLLLLKSQKK